MKLKTFFIATFALLTSSLSAQTAQDSVTITGVVTDFNGTSLDSVSVVWQNRDFSIAAQGMTDKNGAYTVRVLKGKYQSVIAINLGHYVHTAPPSLKDEDTRLECWAWDFIADRDTTFNMRYHRMEAYGIRVFNIPGGLPGYQIFVQPISATRLCLLKREKPEFFKRGENLYGIKQEPLSHNAEETAVGPSPENLKVTVYIDGEKVALLMKQKVKEYYSSDSYGDAYLLTVDAPKKKATNKKYRIFKLELTDLETGDSGEGYYFMEDEKYVIAPI